MFEPILSAGTATRLCEYLGATARRTAPWNYIEQSTPYDGHLLDFHPRKNMLVYDNHKFLFTLLYLEAKRCNKKLTVLHLDRHWDSKLTHLAIFKARQGFVTANDAYNFVNSVLHEGDFLTAACAANLIDKIIFHVPATSQSSIELNLAIFRETFGIDAFFLPKITSTLGLRSENVVLDLDLDLFLDQNGRTVHPPNTLRELFKKDWLAVGVAMSPRHLGGLKAAYEYWQKELGYDLFEQHTG